METTLVDTILEKHAGVGRAALIPILQEVQQAQGFLSQEAVVRIANHLALPASKIYGVATFYNQFRFQPLGKYHFQVCRGTACHVKGSQGIMDALQQSLGVQAGQTGKDGMFSLEVVACLGACGLAPLICVNGEFIGCVTTDGVRRIVKAYRRKVEVNE